MKSRRSVFATFIGDHFYTVVCLVRAISQYVLSFREFENPFNPFFLQDTVVALQALALYSEQTAGNALDLRVKLTSEVEVDWKPPEEHFTPENALLRREIDVRITNNGAISRKTQINSHY